MAFTGLQGIPKATQVHSIRLAEQPGAQAQEPQECTETSGTWEDKRISVYLQGEWGDLEYHIYLPPCYTNGEERYPILLLLHGFYASGTSWEELGLVEALDRLISQRQILPMIVAAPTLPDLINPQLEANQRALQNGLYQHLLKAYRVKGESDAHAIGGYSMGASWAIYLATSYPQAWGRLGLHSPDLRIEEINRLSSLISAIDPAPAVYLDSGMTDAAFPAAQTLHQVLEGSKVEHDWHPGDGGHTEEYWQGKLPDHLLWYAKDW